MQFFMMMTKEMEAIQLHKNMQNKYIKYVIMDDINRFMNQVSFGSKKRYTNYNESIVNSPRDEFMVDIAELRYLSGKFIYLFIRIDILSKYASGIEMPTKKSNSTAIVSRDALNKMVIPKAIASDDGGEFKGRFKQILGAEGIYLIFWITHLSFIDRFTRTIRNTLFERVEQI